MPAGPGETHLTTLFADVHYYFSDPSTKPQHHRFDRGSYVYLFHNANDNRAKLEIANHAGTPDQDAFSGYLDVARVSYSYNQPNLFTITIDGPALQGREQWHLPSYNERNEQKYLYKIYSLDIYLWTEKDGSALLRHLAAILPAAKLNVRDGPRPETKPAEHRDSMSPVVQQLEKTAISPGFTPQRQESTASKQSLPGSPPTSSPAPAAYNPAAPAAPEPFAHREKTPPPPDAHTGTGLNSAARYDSVPQNQYGNVPNTFGGPSQQIPQQGYYSGPPQQQRNPSYTGLPGPPQGTPPGGTQRPSTGSVPPPPPLQTGSGPSPHQYVPSFAGPPTQGQPSQPSSPPPNQQNFGRQSSYGGSGQQYGNYPQQAQQTPSFGPNAAATPGFPSSPPPQQQQQQQQQQPYNPSQHSGAQQEVHGYSSYNYGAAQQGQQYGQYGGYSGDAHSQLYRPTAEEAAAHGHGGKQAQQQQPPKPQSETRTRVETGVTNVEAKVGKFMKRLDRLI